MSKEFISACIYDDLTAAKTLWTQGGINLNDTDAAQQTVLHMCAMRGYVDMVKWLLEIGTDINANDIGNHTPLCVALAGGYSAKKETIAEILLAHGSEVDTVDIIGRTTLHHAVAGGFSDIAKMLVEKGAAADTRDKYGLTPLGSAIRNKDEGLIQWLENIVST